MQSVDKLKRIYNDKVAKQRKNLPRLIHPNRHFFTEIMNDVTHQCLELMLPELVAAKGLYIGVSNGEIPENRVWGSACVAGCPLPLQYGLPCRCWLYKCVKDEAKIPGSLIHPRWRFDAPELNFRWRMSFDRRPRTTSLSVSIDNDDDSDVTEIAPFPTSTSGNRYEDYGEVLYESTVLETHAYAQKIPEAHKKEAYHKYMAEGLKALDERWHGRNDDLRLTPRFGKGPVNRNLKFKKGRSKRALGGNEVAEEAIRLERRRIRAASIEQYRVDTNQRLWEQQEQRQKQELHRNSELSQKMFGDGGLPDGVDDDPEEAYPDIDQFPDIAAPGRVEDVDPVADKDDETDFVFLGSQRARDRSDSLPDMEEFSHAWTRGTKGTFTVPPPSQKTQTSQYFAGTAVPDPTPLGSLSQAQDIDTELPRATRTSRGQPRKKSEAQKEADREKKEQQQRRQREKEAQEKRAEKKKKRLLEPREEAVSQLIDDLEQLMPSQ